jgi:hypothetical protein
MVKFQVMEIFLENIEVLENFPCKDENFRKMMDNIEKFKDLYQVIVVK